MNLPTFPRYLHDFSMLVVGSPQALTGRSDEAINILKENFPDKKTGQLIILTITNKYDELDYLINNFNVSSLGNDRDRYLFYSITARRSYAKANFGSLVYEETVHLQGKANLNIEGMKDTYAKLNNAWDYARRIGYPSDVIMIFDISAFVYSYFNRLNDLFYHFEQILAERPHHIELIKIYTRLLFNENQYEKTINLLNRIVHDLDADDFGMLFLSNYHLKRHRVALNILKERESIFTNSDIENLAFIFCIGSEIAHELLDEISSVRYRELVEGLESGKAILSVSDFIRKSNSDPANRSKYANELYEEYINLKKPIIIAEQLYRFLNPYEVATANIIIELADDIRLVHDINERDYLTLAHALITVDNFEESLSIAEKNIAKEIFDQKWHIIKVVCLQRLGKIGLAYNEIKNSLAKCRFSREHLEQYVHICLKFGLLSEVEDALIDLFDNAECKNDKLSFLSNLISIYFSEIEFKDKLINAVIRFGNLVDRASCDEEGQFLLYFLMLPENTNQEDINDFQQRLVNYTNKFPESQILKRGIIDVDKGPEALISSINKIAGITDEQLSQWEKNKINIRNGNLPVPFSMLDRFISDTRDIFTSWVQANNTSEEMIEFKLNQAPQLEPEGSPQLA
ncbi:hypothetical protein [Shewanella algae]|uniref:hypothetical protein n=1 Tax=Shewanella algae TaxID=38313 RepID=UPI0031F5CD1E